MPRFDEKARESLDSAERLLPDDDGEREALSNSSASRAYYAAYLALADRAQQERMPMSEGGYYRHDTFPDEAHRYRLLNPDQSDDLRLLRDRRIKADYYADFVTLEEASESFSIAKELVRALLKEEA